MGEDRETERSGRIARWLHRPPLFIGSYLVASWALFLPAAKGKGGHMSIDEDRVDRFLYHIPDLTRNPVKALATLATAPWLNHDLRQLVYVTVLLVLFGVLLERREGTTRTAALFFGTTFVGGLGASILLHILYPTWWDTAFAQHAWERTWSGGSAGSFGLAGALAGRVRHPWLLLILLMLWELYLGTQLIHEYTSAFHLIALLTGFGVVRYRLRPRLAAATESRPAAIAR